VGRLGLGYGRNVARRAASRPASTTWRPTRVPRAHDPEVAADGGGMTRPQAPPASGPGNRWLDFQPPKSAAAAGAVLLTSAIAVGDYLTGPYLVFATFYLAPVALAAWVLGRTPALLVAGLAAVLGVVGTALDPQDVTPPVYFANGGFRFVTYSFVALIVSAERSAMQAIRDLAATDPLTGLLNRRRFYEQATVELARAQRAATPVAVVYLDVDELKQRNDTFGHEAGDLMLVDFATTAKATFRTTDLLARLGGDEFCFFLPGTDLDAAHATVERLRHLLQEADVLPVRFSAGIACGRVDGSIDIESVVRSADVLMFEAKAAGKGKSVVRASLTT